MSILSYKRCCCGHATCLTVNHSCTPPDSDLTYSWASFGAVTAGSTTLHRHYNSGYNGWYGFYSVPFPATVNGASRPGILTGVGSPSGCVGVGGGTAANFLILVYCDGFGSLKGNAYWLQFSGTGTQVLLEPGQLYLPAVGAPQLVPQYDWSSTGCSASRYQYTQTASTGPNFNDTSCSPLSITLNYNYQFGAFYVLGYRGAITV